jgi:hypothetical protein
MRKTTVTSASTNQSVVACEPKDVDPIPHPADDFWPHPRLVVAWNGNGISQKRALLQIRARARAEEGACPAPLRFHSTHQIARHGNQRHDRDPSRRSPPSRASSTPPSALFVLLLCLASRWQHRRLHWSRPQCHAATAVIVQPSPRPDRPQRCRRRRERHVRFIRTAAHCDRASFSSSYLEKKLLRIFFELNLIRNAQVLGVPHLILSLGIVLAADKFLKQAFVAASIKFPSSLFGMLCVFSVLVILDTFVPALAKAFMDFFEPATLFIQRWLPLFYVPSLVVLPLAVRDIPAASGLKIFAIACTCN